MSELPILIGGTILVAGNDGLGCVYLHVRTADDTFYDVRLMVADDQDEPYVAVELTPRYRLAE